MIKVRVTHSRSFGILSLNKYKDGDIVSIYTLNDLLDDRYISDQEKEKAIESFAVFNAIGYIPKITYTEDKKHFVAVYGNECEVLVND